MRTKLVKHWHITDNQGHYPQLTAKWLCNRPFSILTSIIHCKVTERVIRHLSVPGLCWGHTTLLGVPTSYGQSLILVVFPSVLGCFLMLRIAKQYKSLSFLLFTSKLRSIKQLLDLWSTEYNHFQGNKQSECLAHNSATNWPSKPTRLAGRLLLFHRPWVELLHSSHEPKSAAISNFLNLLFFLIFTKNFKLI